MFLSYILHAHIIIQLHHVGRSHYIPEVHSRQPLIGVRLAHLPNATLREEDTNERRIVATRPLLHRKRQRIRVVLGRIAELQHAVHRDARVVEAEAEEGQLKVEVLVQLRHGGVDVRLVVAVVAVATLVEEPVQEVAAQLLQTGRADRVAAAVVPVRGRLGRGHAIVGVWWNGSGR